MANEVVTPLFEWLNSNPELAGLVTFLISAGESVAVIGTIVPGSITMTAIGALAGAGIIPLWGTIFWAIMGAIVGDGISYWMGYYFKNRLPNVWPFRTNPGLLKTGEVFFRKYGSMSVFIGRFVGPVRAIVPLIAGMLGMRPFSFFIANILSAILWAPAYMLPGILLGAAAQELPPDIALHVIMVILLFVLLILLCLWFMYKFFQLLHVQIEELRDWIWHRLKKSRYFSATVWLLRHHDEKRTTGQLRLAIYFVFICLLCAITISYVFIKGPENIAINDVIFHLFRGIRSPTVDNVMIYVTMLGEKKVLLPAVFIVFAWLLLTKRFWTALHVLGLGITATLAVYVIKHMVQTPRPWGIIYNTTHQYSMPSGHTTLATTVFLGLAFLLATTFTSKKRWLCYVLALLLAFAVGLSRLYLGAHWFTDVLTAWLLSAAVLIVIIISYRRLRDKPLNSFAILLVSIISIVACLSIFSFTHFEKFKAVYAQLDFPTREIPMNEWWLKNASIPSVRASLFGFPSQRINLEWAGKLDRIEETLLQEGWSSPPARNWISTLHRIADISSTEYLPMVSPQYLDKKPVLILTRRFNDENNQKRLLVVRLWEASTKIQENQTPLWVGTLGIVPRTYSWIYKKFPSDIEIDPTLVFPQKSAAGEWEWRIVNLIEPTGKNKFVTQKVMLIRQNKFVHRKTLENIHV